MLLQNCSHIPTWKSQKIIIQPKSKMKITKVKQQQLFIITRATSKKLKKYIYIYFWP